MAAHPEISPSEETQQQIAAHIRTHGRVPSLDAYGWTLRELERLEAAANAYRGVHNGKAPQGFDQLTDMICKLRQRKASIPQRRLGWSKNYGEIRVRGIDIDRASIDQGVPRPNQAMERTADSRTLHF
jgi:hypothetical protein